MPDTQQQTDPRQTDPAIAVKGYARADALVSTDWLTAHLSDANLRIIESDEDVLLYDTGHIPGASKIDWHLDLNDPLMRDYISREQFQELLRSRNIDDTTTIVFYGDKNNWWAAYAFWVFQLFGFTNARLLDGGRVKWEQEGRPLTTDLPPVSGRSTYVAKDRSDGKIRAFMTDVRRHLDVCGMLVDVRSPDDFSG